MKIEPKAMAIPKSTDHLEKGKYGPIFPKTPACYGFTIVANVKPGRADAMRGYGERLAKALEADPHVLAPLKLHYLRWVLFDNDTRFMYQGIFDTDFDKYTEDAVVLFRKAGIDTAFENLEGFPDGLEDEHGGVRQVRSRPPVQQLPRVRRVPVLHERRDQEGPEDQGGVRRDARADAVGAVDERSDAPRGRTTRTTRRESTRRATGG